MSHSARLTGQSGFTLLEILLVIVIMAVTSMMVVPNYFSSRSVSLDDEGQRLAGVLRLATEEATLSGNAFRVLLRQHSYQFQSVDAEGAWQNLQASPYQKRAFAEGIGMAEVRPEAPLKEQLDSKKGQEPVLAALLLRPEGIGRIYDLILATETVPQHTVTVQLRPGPGGIAVKLDDGMGDDGTEAAYAR